MSISDNVHDVAAVEPENAAAAGRSEDQLAARLLSYLISTSLYQPPRDPATPGDGVHEGAVDYREATPKRGRSYIGRRSVDPPHADLVARRPAAVKRFERERVYIGKRTRAPPTLD